MVVIRSLPESMAIAADLGHENRRRSTIRRSLALFAAFRREQSDPDYFYGTLAVDSAEQLGCFTALSGAVLLDVGGGPGYFADAFGRAGARYFAVDADLGELSAKTAPGPNTVLGSGVALPIADAAVDICYSSNVLEHVSDPTRMAEEMVRVTRPGGVVFLSYTTWLSPWGGHETAPWHYLGGARAARRYTRKHGRAPKNEYGRTLFPISAATMLSWSARAQDAGQVDVVARFPRYHPGWAHRLVSIPGIREVALWNLVIVLRRR